MSRRAGIPKLPAVFDKAVELAEQAGWKIVCPSRGRHIQWKPLGSRKIIVTSTTPSDHRATRNDIARLRRAGLRI